MFIQLPQKSRQYEIDLILLCTRVPIEPEIAERIHTLVLKIQDWEYVLQAAIHHRIIPLVYQSLNQSCPQSIPPGVLNRLRCHFQANAKRNLLLTASLFKVLSEFESQNILVVSFKGPVLAETVYGDLYLRIFCDLDILVYERDALKAFNLLVSMGYNPEVKLNARQIRAYVKTEYSIALFTEGRDTIIELHWGLTGRYVGPPFRLDHFSDRLERLTLVGREVNQLPPEERLVYLCIHGSKDSWGKLESISSIAALIGSRKDLDWTRVADQARRMKCERILFLGLFLAHDLIGADLPVSIRGRIDSDQTIKRVAEGIYNRILPQEIGELAGQVCSDFSSCHLMVKNTGLDKMLFVMRLVFQPSREDWRRFPLPGGFAFLYYLLRPLRLISEVMAKG